MITTIATVLVIVFVLVVLCFAAFIFGANYDRDPCEWRKGKEHGQKRVWIEAVKRGHGSWHLDESGEAEFRWNEK